MNPIEPAWLCCGVLQSTEQSVALLCGVPSPPWASSVVVVVVVVMLPSANGVACIMPGGGKVYILHTCGHLRACAHDACCGFLVCATTHTGSTIAHGGHSVQAAWCCPADAFLLTPCLYPAYILIRTSRSDQACVLQPLTKAG